MPVNDPNPLPYGTLDYYQIHYIVQGTSEDGIGLVAKCVPITQNRQGDRKIVGVRWIGSDRFVGMLEADVGLTDLLKQVLEKEGELRVDPTGDEVRIYGKWKSEEGLEFDKEMFELADKIAGHIKRMRSFVAES